MAMGVPVVASWQAAGGVDAVPGEHILVARSAEDYAEKLLRLMDDGAARRALANAGRARVETNHSWARSVARLDRLIDDCLQRRGSAERSEEHTSELQSLMRISYAVFCLTKKKTHKNIPPTHIQHT